MALGSEGTLNRALSPHEQMDLAGLEHYWRAGESALACVEDGLRAAGRPAVSFDGAPYGVWTILDLPCGQGRVLRHLRRAFPRALITACDLHREGVEFCASTFGAIPLHSADDPARISAPADHFDLVWVGSLFTHVDAPKWDGFLEVFRRALRPGGVLVFTTHGERTHGYLKSRATTLGNGEAEVGILTSGYERDGFAYARYPGSEWNYGTTLSATGWVAERIAANGGLRPVKVAEHAWDNHQDCFTCVRDA